MNSLRRFLTDDCGQDLVEYVLLGATLALASLVLANVFPGIMNAVYVSWNNAAQALWYPQAPAN
jgi:Flp pilus assembly pilin Flp